MKAYKIITIITVILAIAVITAAAIFGIYKQEEYKVVNITPKYIFGMEFTESIILTLTVDDSVKEKQLYDEDNNLITFDDGEITDIEYDDEFLEGSGYHVVEILKNPPEVLTEENFDKAKNILIDRLIAIGAEQYVIRQDKVTGTILVEIPNDMNKDFLVSTLTSSGKFEIIDTKTKEVLMSNEYIDMVTIAYAREEVGTSLYLQIKFNKAGIKKFEEISKTYIEIEVEGAEEGEESTTEQKQISIKLDDEVIRTTYFAQPVTDGVLNLYMGTATDQAKYQAYMKEANSIIASLNKGASPITYIGTYEGMESDIDSNAIRIFAITMAVLSVAVLLLLLVRFKLKGIYVFILEIGYIAILSFVIRLTNVVLTTEGIMGIIVVSLLNVAFMYMILNTMQKEGIILKESLKENIIKYTIVLIPICIISLIFIFATSLNVSSLGGTIFWGIILMYMYNTTFTRVLFSVTEKGA